MRVNDLAKEIGKSNKEIIGILQSRGDDIKSHFSNINDEQVGFVKAKLGTKNESAQAKPGSSKEEHMQTGKTESPVKTNHDEHQEHKKEEHSEPAKKKLTAVFRPQNAQQAKQQRNKMQRSAHGMQAEAKTEKAKREHSEVKAEKAMQEHSEVKTDMVKQEHSEMKIEKAPEIAAPKMESPSAAAAKPEAEVKTSPSAASTTENRTTEAANIQEKTAAPISPFREPLQRTIEIKGNVYADRAAREAKEAERRAQSGTPAGQPTRNVYDRNGSGNRTQGDRNRTQGDRNFNSANRTQGDRNRTWGDRQPGSGGRQYADRQASDRGFNGQQRTQGARTAGGGAQNRSFGDRNGGQNRSFSDRPAGQRSFGDRSFAGGRQQGGRSFGDNPFDKDKDAAPRGGFSKPKSAGKDAKPSVDAPLAKKTSSTRLNKNQFKNQKNDKKHRTEDGPAKGGKVTKHPFIMPTKKVEAVEEDIKEIIIPERITIKDFAAKLKLQPSTIVKKLFLKGELVTLNSELDFEKAEELALEYDVICTMEEKVDVIAELLKEDDEEEENLMERPPVVCVIGHIDHGKTSLLDAIRKTNVTSREAGGITQHIGAYMVKINDRPITFLDTPGHEAFTAMRMRGAQSTDIAILVVAADDGVMPQTVEAISHAKAANVEIIVAINKIDKPGANIERVKQELSEYELIPESWGGSTVFCEVSAKNGDGIDNLLEMIILTAEVKELKSNPNRKARGVVIEAKLDKGKGAVATILVQKGTLRVGDYVSAGACSGKVRAMINDKGQKVKEATPSMPVEIQGLDNAPNAGEVLVAANNHNEAKEFAATFISENKNKLIEDTKAKLSLDDLFSKIQEGNLKELPLIVKADVQGSVEAVKQSLLKLSNEEVQVRIIHGGVGSINESDVALAAASNAIIIGFNVRPDVAASTRSESEGVDIRLYKVIYAVIDDIESAMKGMLAPVFEEKIIGHAEIRKVYKASGIGSIAGSYVLDGKFQRGCKVRISRAGEQIFEGNLASLKRFQDDVKEVAAGYECGLAFEKFNDIEELDIIEGYIMVQVPRK